MKIGSLQCPSALSTWRAYGLDQIITSRVGRPYLEVFDSSGNFLYKFGKSGSLRPGELRSVVDVAVDSSERIIVAGSFNHIHVSGVSRQQRPGDCNGDGRLNLSDGVCVLERLFGGTLCAPLWRRDNQAPSERLSARLKRRRQRECC